MAKVKNLSELGRVIAAAAGCSIASGIKGAKAAVESLAEGIESTRDGREAVVNISGLGTFQAKTMEARQARAPRTGEIVNVEENVRILFHPSKRLRAAIMTKNYVIYGETAGGDVEDEVEEVKPAPKKAAAKAAKAAPKAAAPKAAAKAPAAKQAKPAEAAAPKAQPKSKAKVEDEDDEW